MLFLSIDDYIQLQNNKKKNSHPLSNYFGIVNNVGMDSS